MGARYLLELADAIRAAGVSVNEGDGRWHFRGRATGGYEAGRPTHVMWHHTASPTSWDGKKDYEYIAWGKEFAPIANVYVDRNGVAWICAGGATNTNGVGKDTWGGGVPENRMNEYAIGIEIGNNGVGEHYPAAQRAAILKIGVALTKQYIIPVGHHRAHFEWRPNGKIDPAGPPTPWARPGDQYMRWNMDQFRGDIWLASLPVPTTPVQSVGPMNYYFLETTDPRILDTRQPHPQAKKKPGVYTVTVGGQKGIPSNVAGVKINITATEPTNPGYFTVWSGKGSRPISSNLNFSKDWNICNTTDTLCQNGKFSVYTHAETHIVIDVLGYYTT